MNKEELNEILYDFNSCGNYCENKVQTYLVKKLIEDGADINLKDSEGYTSLHCASANNNIELAKYLISKGADINSKITGNFNDGKTPLHIAVMEEYNEMVELLIYKNANINEKDYSNCTPLDIANYDNEKILKILKEHGAKTSKELQEVEK